MQERHVLGAAPIPSIQRIAADQVERTRNRPTVPFRENQQQPVAHRLPDQRKECARQIGLPPFARAGVLVKGPERIPMRLGDRRPAQMANRQALSGGGAFLADRLALAAGQRAEEIVEAAIARVSPVKLRPFADQPSGSLERGDLVGGDEGCVRRRQPGVGGHRLDRPDRRTGRGIAVRRWMDQNTRAGDGGEGHRDLELGVIVLAGALPRIGPGVVEHIFALAVPLGIARHHRQRRVVGTDDQRQRLPAGAGADRSRFLERRQKRMAQKRIGIARAGVPPRARNRRDAGGDMGSHDGFAHPPDVGRLTRDARGVGQRQSPDTVNPAKIMSAKPIDSFACESAASHFVVGD